MKRIITLVLLPIFLSSCVSTKIVSLGANNSSSIKNKTVAVIHNDRPSFAEQTPRNVMISTFTGGILGYMAMVKGGEKIIKKHVIEDPAIAISTNISSYLRDNYGVKVKDAKEVKKISRKVSKISAQYKGIADYVLDVRTVNWSIAYLPMKLDNYRVIYSAQLKLIDVEESKVIAKGFCNKEMSDRERNNPPSYNMLLGRNAALLKEELNLASRECAKLFKNKVFE